MEEDIGIGDPELEDICTYCGEPCDTRDHVIPFSYTSVHPANKRDHRSNKEEDTVPCCMECNQMLGNRLLTTVATRAAYLIGATERRYSKLLEMPDWTEDELEDLGYALRTNIETSIDSKRIVQERLRYLTLVSLRT